MGCFFPGFRCLEDGKKQNLNFFSISPFALSVAVIFDVGMADVAVQKVIRLFLLLKARSASLMRSRSTPIAAACRRPADFAAVGKRLAAALDSLRYVTGRNNGPPVTSGPLGPQGPIINGVPMDQSSPRVVTLPKESHVLKRRPGHRRSGFG